MIDYKIYAYIALGLITIYLGIRIAGRWAVNKLIRAEFEHVLNSDKHKVRGRYE